ncbi:4-coumarate-CoA ligase 1 [Smittium mucronatum]|uniref:4-coumarate-CoA ligase 1 n=1 Tax=Smittium mucronatum TaxID=133383 RepID=A0A1R0H7G0_9FUNG|nr:4-coumarate-CoA ligase 1 [Smittium mucronatum]
MIFNSRIPDVFIPNVDISTYCLSKGKASHDSLMMKTDYCIKDYYTKRSFSIIDLEVYSAGLASGLMNNLNFKKDDVLAIFSQNSIFYPIAIFGTLMTGGVVTLANPTYNARELAHQLKDSGATIIATQSALLDTVKGAISLGNFDIPDSKIMLIDTCKNEADEAQHISDIYSDLPFTRYIINDQFEAENKIAVLSYSSGTTGLSKGVMLTHKNILTSVIITSDFSYADGQYDRSVAPPVFVSMLPFYHIYGLVANLFIGIVYSIGMVVLPKFDIHSFLKLIQDERVTFAHIVPPTIVSMINEPATGKYDLSSLRFAMTGAAPLGKEVLARFCQKFKNVSIIRSYGLTEASPTICISGKNYPFDGSSGVLLSNTQAKVVDENGVIVGVGQVGELCFRGTNIMKGYLNNPKSTKDTIDSDGFLHTGDIGYLDEKTNIFIVDRMKELIKYKGFQVAPAELESLLLLHDDVAESAVIGIYHENMATELPKAFVTLTSLNTTLTGSQKIEKANQVLTWINGQVAPHKKLRGGIQVVDVIPKSASGKILRRELRDAEKKKLYSLEKASKL